MKRIVSFVIVLLMCVSMALSVSAVEGDFVPSITYKDSPFVVKVVLNGEDVTDCIVVTSINDAKNKTTDITQEERDLLLKVYGELSNGGTLPIDEDYVIRHLVDVSFKYEGCRSEESHKEKIAELDKSGVTIEITFDLGVDKYMDVNVLAYNDGVWSPITSVTNNGDGTVTCVFEHFCPVAFAVGQSQNTTNTPQTGDAAGQELMLWGGLFGAAVVGLIAAVAVYARKRKHA